MPILSLEAIVSSAASLRRAIALLDFARDNGAVASRDLIWLNAARANAFNACQLLVDFPVSDYTQVSVVELVLKAEVSLAEMGVWGNDLSLRLADTLLLGVRVSIESFRTLPESEEADARNHEG
jgi:hypothetical protein